MIDARHFTLRLLPIFAALLITASCTAIAVAQSAATSSDQWRAAGAARNARNDSQQSAPASSTSPTWRLPNGQSNTGETQLIDEDSNPLRQSRKSQPTAGTREPRAFQPPVNASPLNASPSSANNNSNPPMQQRAVTPASATRPAHVATQAYMQPPAVPNRAPMPNQRPAYQPVTRAPANNQHAATNTAEDLWQNINVAFQTQAAPKQPTPTQKKYISENLPMPGDGDDFPDPVMRSPSGPDAFRQPMCGPYYQPYGNPGMCCNEGGCPTGCCDGVCEPGCGCPCGEPCGEPGCGCEPSCGCPSGNCGNCQKDVFCIGPGDDESCHIVQIRWPKWQEVMVFGGVQGFKGPYDLNRDSGNFGFNEGFNIGAKIPYAELGYQYGYRGAQSQLNGDKDTGIDKQFFQSFVTAGIFHRSKEGLQFGVAWDALVDERWHSENFHQIRSEISVINCGCHEFGFDATVGVNSHKVEDPDNIGTFLNFQASDQYVLFYRLHGCNGGEGRVYAGANNDSDGIVGSDMLIPIGDRFSVQAGFTYLIPNQKAGTEGATNESWNIAMGLVWHWDGQARKCFNNCYRPMFNVADNGLLILDNQDKNN